MKTAGYYTPKHPDGRPEPARGVHEAAETVAAYENRFGKIETDLGILKGMVGFNLAATVGLIFLQLHH